MPIKNLKQKYLLSILFFSVIELLSMFLPYFEVYESKKYGFSGVKKIINDPVKFFKFNYYTFLFLIFFSLLWICYLIIKELLDNDPYLKIFRDLLTITIPLLIISLIILPIAIIDYYSFYNVKWKVGILILIFFLFLSVRLSFLGLKRINRKEIERILKKQEQEKQEQIKKKEKNKVLIEQKSGEEILALIKKLKELKDSGIISEEEFEQKKKELLDKL